MTINENYESFYEKEFEDEENDIIHYGTKRHSGRYPWGSGENPYQHEAFFSSLNKLKAQGMSEKEIADQWGISTTRLRQMISIAGDQERMAKYAVASSMKNQGYSNVDIGKRLGINESSVRSLFNENSANRMKVAQQTADFLKQQVDEKGMIDVGKGVEVELGVTRQKLDEAMFILELQGYKVLGGGVKQVTNVGKQTNIMVIAPPGTEAKEIYNFDNIHSITEYSSTDDGQTFWKMEKPAKLSSSRIQIRYPDEKDKYGATGADKDGVIEIRRGCKDLDLGDNTHYAQVRILCDGEKYGLEGDRYLKGMAVYSDDMPDGIDVIFNTSKARNNNGKILKEAKKDDPINPFGSTIKAQGQYHYIDDDGVEKLGLINKKNDEGDWNEWSKKLPSQVLAKQNADLVKRQLNLSIADKQEEHEDILALENPVVKKKLLRSYALECDSNAVDLQAAALPRQKYQVILPASTLKDNECYAPNFKDGEKLALIRFPHGGTFEIPIVYNNTRNREAKELIGANASDALCINHISAERLSGADFDGDTVLAIPISAKANIENSKRLKDLIGFDPHVEYAGYPGMQVMKKRRTGVEMGEITNLITDMTIKGANDDELARAVKHSMVVIDAHKHELDYKRSFTENGIQELKNKYQAKIDPETGKVHYGATTILSRAKAQASAIKTKGAGRIDPETGEMIYKLTDRVDSRTGKLLTRQSTQMAETKDAYTLVSDIENPVEMAYAGYANKLKALANQARKESLNVGKLEYSKEAREQYSEEVTSLESKLKLSLLNAPKERKAQLIANTIMKRTLEDNPELESDTEKKKKVADKALKNARAQVGAKRVAIDVTPNEWKAIQAGAVSETFLSQILDHTDQDVIIQYAMPKQNKGLSVTKINKIKQLSYCGYTNQEIAEIYGISASSVSRYLKE